jgi:protein-S-isoprenylcysteine O-methyltransferase
MRTLFPSVAEAVVFWAVLVANFAIVLAWVVRNREARGDRRRDLVPLILLAMLVDVAIGYARIGPMPHWLFYVGEALFIAGGVFTTWSYSRLGRNLSPYVEVLPDHVVIEAGPYRYLRHPGYLGQLIAFVGLGLALQSWVALLLILIVAVVLLTLRIRMEEQHMAKGLGQPYTDYMARTKRLIPFVW